MSLLLADGALRDRGSLEEARLALERLHQPVLEQEILLDALSVFSQLDRKEPFVETVRFGLVGAGG